jgi:hypothetical protein
VIEIVGALSGVAGNLSTSGDGDERKDDTTEDETC